MFDVAFVWAILVSENGGSEFDRLILTGFDWFVLWFVFLQVVNNVECYRGQERERKKEILLIFAGNWSKNCM